MHMNEVSVRDTIYAHLHDRFISHADLDAAVTSSAAMAVLAGLFTLAAVSCLLAHTILVIVIWLTAGALGAQVLVQPNEALLGTLELGLLVRLHCLLLLRVYVI